LADNQETSGDPAKFDFTAYPPDTLFHERREPIPEPHVPSPPPEERDRPSRKERRRRIDPTTFEKQYTDDELEFMTAMQRYKVQTGKAFPSYGEVLRVARELGYGKDSTDEPTPG
jgi:hypothetical protein